MRQVKVEIEFLRDYLQHRRPIDKETIDKLKTVTKTLQRDPDNEEAYSYEAEAALYKTPEGEIYIPPKHIEGALIKAGVNERQAGKGKKTYKDIMKAFVEVADEHIVINPQEYELHREWVKVNQARIMRTRPLIKRGTKATFTLNIFDDALSMDILKSILEYAGGYVGIGDWRPKFGLFKVNEFKA